MGLGNIFYVYVFFRPWDGSPFYVGKGHGNRWGSHEKDVDKHYNSHLANIIKKAKRLGLEIPKVKIRQNLPEQEAFEIEFALIKAIGRGPGLLVNLTDGGKGVSGMRHTRKSKEAIRKALLGNKHSVGNKNCLGRVVSNKTRRRMRKSALGHKRWLGKNHKPETCEKIRTAVTKQWTDPEWYDMMLEIRRKQGKNPEYRIKRKAIAKTLWENPEYRAKNLAARKSGPRGPRKSTKPPKA